MNENNQKPRLRAIASVFALALAVAGAFAVPTAAAEGCSDGGIGQQTGCKVDSSVAAAGGAVDEVFCIWSPTC